MVHVFQVGVGSGGMPVLDLVARDLRVAEVTIVEPDVYKEHNVVRHVFGMEDVGRAKVELARRWLGERRPELVVNAMAVDLCDPDWAAAIDAAVGRADLGICAADNETAKHQFNSLMLKHRKPWTLGEVLAGGIGGFVHRFVPGGPCYGCVASFLKRSVTTEQARPADYSQPGGGVAETAIPASKAAIAVIAGLHAQITLAMLDSRRVGYCPPSPRPSPPGVPGGEGEEFTSLLFTLQRVPGIFDEVYRPYKFRVPRAAACLLCHPIELDDLDRRLDDALDRLGS